MLSTADSFANSLLQLKPSQDSVEAVNNFVAAVANFTNQVQATGGTPGILTFGNQAMASIILTMQPVRDNSWIPNFVSAWQAGILASIITPGTVTNAVWIGSAGLDTLTLPSAAATILTLPAAVATLTSGLAQVVPTQGPPIPMATALRNATLALTFNAIGLGAPPSYIPIPIPLAAQ